MRSNHMIIRETSWIEVKSARDTITTRGTKETLPIRLVEEDGGEGSLNDEINLPTNAISQMNLYAFINFDRSTIPNDEKTPSTNTARRRDEKSPCVDCRWCRAFIRGVVDWCGSVVGWVGRRAGGVVPLDIGQSFVQMCVPGGDWSVFRATHALC